MIAYVFVAQYNTMLEMYPSSRCFTVSEEIILQYESLTTISLHLNSHAKALRTATSEFLHFSVRSVKPRLGIRLQIFYSSDTSLTLPSSCTWQPCDLATSGGSTMLCTRIQNVVGKVSYKLSKVTSVTFTTGTQSRFTVGRITVQATDTSAAL